MLTTLNAIFAKAKTLDTLLAQIDYQKAPIIKTWMRQGNVGTEIRDTYFINEETTGHAYLNKALIEKKITDQITTLQTEMETLLRWMMEHPLTTYMEYDGIIAVVFDPAQGPKLTFSYIYGEDAKTGRINDRYWRNLVAMERIVSKAIPITKASLFESRIAYLHSITLEDFTTDNTWEVLHPDIKDSPTIWNTKTAEDALRAHMALLEPWMLLTQDYPISTLVRKKTSQAEQDQLFLIAKNGLLNACNTG